MSDGTCMGCGESGNWCRCNDQDEDESITTDSTARIWSYSFSTWPDETWYFDKAVFQLFEMLKYRVEFDFTESQFERFRSGLSHHGLTLREIERVPYFEPERVCE